MEWISLITESVLNELCHIAEKTPDGVFVEFGVYKGGSAQYLSRIAETQHRELHLFDTFTGIPFFTEGDSHAIGEFSDTSLKAVKALIPSAVFHVGEFPATMPKDFPRVAFLHIDADQYQSYVDGIKLFSPLMVPGGVMWFDDYGCLACADKAVNEAFPDSLIKAECGKFYVKFQ